MYKGEKKQLCLPQNVFETVSKPAFLENNHCPNLGVRADFQRLTAFREGQISR